MGGCPTTLTHFSLTRTYNMTAKDDWMQQLGKLAEAKGTVSLVCAQLDGLSTALTRVGNGLLAQEMKQMYSDLYHARAKMSLSMQALSDMLSVRATPSEQETGE
jgi:hypothetical protein